MGKVFKLKPETVTISFKSQSPGDKKRAMWQTEVGNRFHKAVTVVAEIATAGLSAIFRSDPESNFELGYRLGFIKAVEMLKEKEDLYEAYQLITPKIEALSDEMYRENT